MNPTNRHKNVIFAYDGIGPRYYSMNNDKFVLFTLLRM